MKTGVFTCTIVVVITTCTYIFTNGTHENAEPAKMKAGKKSERSSEDRFTNVSSIAFSPGKLLSATRPEPGQRYPWKANIVTTIFWIGEKPAPNNPVPNRVSSWDKEWTKNYGRLEDPDSAHRSNHVP